MSGTSGTNMFNIGGSSDSAFLIKVDINSMLLGMQEQTSGNINVNVYPNPATNNVSVRFAKTVGADADIAIMDITGRKIMEEQRNLKLNSVQSFDVSTLSKGVYFLKVISDKGNEVVKFLKE